MSARGGLWAFFRFAILFALADQAIKRAVDGAFGIGETLPVLPGYFTLTHLRNPGGAFSLLGGLPPYWGRPFFICATLAALAFVFYLYWWQRPATRWGRAGLFLVFGGGLGNLIDRVAYGEVIDYLLFYYGAYYWPAFNLADSGITVGVCLIGLDMLRQPAKSRKNA